MKSPNQLKAYYRTNQQKDKCDKYNFKQVLMQKFLQLVDLSFITGSGFPSSILRASPQATW